MNCENVLNNITWKLARSKIVLSITIDQSDLVDNYVINLLHANRDLAKKLVMATEQCSEH